MHMACSMSNDVNTAEVSTQPVGLFLQPSCRLEQKACWPCWPHAHPPTPAQCRSEKFAMQSPCALTSGKQT